jgi:hypothetical protein
MCWWTRCTSRASHATRRSPHVGPEQGVRASTRTRFCVVSIRPGPASPLNVRWAFAGQHRVAVTSQVAESN